MVLLVVLFLPDVATLDVGVWYIRGMAFRFPAVISESMGEDAFATPGDKQCEDGNRIEGGRRRQACGD